MRIARSVAGNRVAGPVATAATRGFKSNKSLAKSSFPRQSIFDAFDSPLFGLAPTLAGSMFGPSFSSMFSPKTDLSETSDHFRISVDLPGLKREEVRVTVSKDNVLTIEGERKQESEKEEEGKEGAKIYRSEKSYGRFMRRFELPFGVEASAIEVSFKNGVLEVLVPKPKGAPKQDEQVLEIKE